ncbi:hypothetical protein EZI54_23490 [Marinobacter halodurans]|uniref:Haemolysin-type calcium binding-related domain-containing protein n=1 Tax=Marinobacter halodurans TaxID=2528979 RepID=A0ABY1ZD99_9GAMM|nr:hypothetical protein [Marinobacter halodurans]TBW45609.1 hypothetical protein EZI54_23490 [Marinobacter halodurans]
MFSFSWVIGSGENAQGGNTNDVQLESVLETVDLILEKSGSLTLDMVDGDQIGPESLQVETDGSKSVISLGENTSDDYIVRTFTNTSGLANDETVSILGNEWDLRLVCKDSGIVKAIIKEFLSTGNVSRDLLS